MAETWTLWPCEASATHWTPWPPEPRVRFDSDDPTDAARWLEDDADA